jgi:hypothetical protein
VLGIGSDPVIVDVLAAIRKLSRNAFVYRKRAFKAELRIGTMLWRAFDKKFEPGYP